MAVVVSLWLRLKHSAERVKEDLVQMRTTQDSSSWFQVFGV